MHDHSDPARRHAMPMPRGLYLITPDEPDDARLAGADRAPARLCGVPAISQQARTGAAAPAAGRRAARRCAAMRAFRLSSTMTPRLAAAVGADGVHLGEHDGAIAAARALLGNDAIIGVSCYDDIQRARVAAAQGADYLAFGAFFPSATKPDARRAPLDLLAAARATRTAACGDRRDNAGQCAGTAGGRHRHDRGDQRRVRRTRSRRRRARLRRLLPLTDFTEPDGYPQVRMPCSPARRR